MLTTPDDLGVSNTEVQEVHQTWTTFNKVMAATTNEGFRPLRPPGVECPDDHLDFDRLATYDKHRIANEFGRYNAWRDYAAERCAYSEMIIKETMNELKKYETIAKTRMRAEKDAKKKAITASEVSEYALTTFPRYEELLRQLQEHQQLEILYTAKRRQFSNTLDLISRMITMRGQDLEASQRATNVGAQGAHLPPTQTGF